jgi:hypothetical protein
MLVLNSFRVRSYCRCTLLAHEWKKFGGLIGHKPHSFEKVVEYDCVSRPSSVMYSSNSKTLDAGLRNGETALVQLPQICVVVVVVLLSDPVVIHT